MKISIIGLGYVGTSVAAGFSNLGYSVIGVDKIPSKVEKINKGMSSVDNTLLNQLVKKGTQHNLLEATSNLERAILDSDFSFVCVETPPTEDGDVNPIPLEKSLRDIGEIIKNKKNHTIVIKSTIFPTYLNSLKDILEVSSNKKCYKDFGFAINPEFLREKTCVKDFFNPPFIIVGSENKQNAREVMNLYGGINGKKFIVEEKLALMMKYVNNPFHALKVAYTNEIASICKKVGVDGTRLMEIFCEDTILNISPYYLKPGEAYGGSCLPKDLSVLQKSAKKFNVNLPVVQSISLSNEEQKKKDTI